MILKLGGVMNCSRTDLQRHCQMLKLDDQGTKLELAERINTKLQYTHYGHSKFTGNIIRRLKGIIYFKNRHEVKLENKKCVKCLEIKPLKKFTTLNNQIKEKCVECRRLEEKEYEQVK
jgi:hypothetical protein